MDLVLFGIQGSGKGTQAKALAQKYNFVIFETGAECRRLATENSELGKKVKEIVDAGNLVPAHIVIQILENFLSKLPPTQKVIFDGIPRNQEQHIEFDKLIARLGRDFLAVNITLPQEETIKRLLVRGRHDDLPEVITNRIKIFIRDTSPIIEDYRSQNKIFDINGNQPIEDVSKEIFSKFDQYFLK
ncbi:nucleoside monophosphate kinase [Candidatus Peregrinibacteria bacterium]|nr:nucleoside monophosphate kinase [Candidatus Peregrinibacteria bacterium]